MLAREPLCEENCRLKVYFGPKVIGDFYLTTRQQSKSIVFENDAMGYERIAIDFVNDGFDTSTGEDRNVYLKSITIARH